MIRVVTGIKNCSECRFDTPSHSTYGRTNCSRVVRLNAVPVRRQRRCCLLTLTGTLQPSVLEFGRIGFLQLRNLSCSFVLDRSIDVFDVTIHRVIG